MDSEKISIQKWSLVAGLLTGTGLIAYFLIMKFLGLIEILELRFLNIIILFTGIALTLNYFRLKTNGQFAYLEGLALGFFTTLVSVGMFGIFIFLYLSQFDPGFFRYIQANGWFGEYLTPVTATIAVLLEGISSGAMITFIAMQYFKREETKTEIPDERIFGNGNKISTKSEEIDVNR